MSASPKPPASGFAAELATTAAAMVKPGKGLLAADESTGTIGKRFDKNGVANTRENRVAYRELLFSTPGIGEFLSGVIMFEETLFATASDGETRLVDLLLEQGVIPGVKVDMGVTPLYGTHGETLTQGCDDLGQRCARYYEAGARFAKWRAVLHIHDSSGATPSELAIRTNADMLARYAAICQMNGLVPIVEPEVLMEGKHSLEAAQAATEKVLAAVYKALSDHHVFLEGTVLKPNMCRPGDAAPSDLHASPAAVALATIYAMRRTVPPAVPGIAFLSGGMSEEDATIVLNEMKRMEVPTPWALTFSYGRALQATCLKVWRGDKANEPAAQKEFILRAKANSLATLGKYAGEAARGAAGAPPGFLPGLPE